jgi:hypothetical protein
MVSKSKIEKAKVTVKCRECGELFDENALTDGLCYECLPRDQKGDPPPVHMSDEQVAELFELRYQVSMAETSLESATLAKKLATDHYNRAVERLRQAVDDARSGQTNLFDKPAEPASPPADEGKSLEKKP